MSRTETVKILQQLQANLEDHSLTAQDEEALLSQLKVLSRQPGFIKQHCTAEVVPTLANYGLKRRQSNEALRCLANALFLVEEYRQVLVDHAYAIDAAEALKSCDVEKEFLLCRIIFLLTYKTNLDFEKLHQRTDLCASVIHLCQRHADFYAGDKTHSSTQQQALDELLRLLFNLAYLFPPLAKHLEAAVRPLTLLLLSFPLQNPVLQPPTTSLINALLNVDIEGAAGTLERDKTVEKVLDQLVLILSRAVKQHDIKSLDTLASPLCTLLRRIGDAADTQVKKQLTLALLPQEHERVRPLGEGDTLAARLLRMSTSADLPNLGQNISSLLFELSDKDPEKFVHNIGYGYASGYLLSHGMTAPVPSSTATDHIETPLVNPVTGQHIERESTTQSALSEMSDEEKEREAERLFVLFERLKATGVVDVKNPIERLYKEDT